MRKLAARFGATAMLACALFSNLRGASEQWIKLGTPHFELYTTAGEKKGREAILYFEQVRSFFSQASPARREQAPVRIVAFRSENQYKPYRMNEGSLAYYAQSRNREFIVMQDISTEHYPAAIHEFTHLIVQRDGLKLPVWLNEGWAELYSSLKPQGNKAVVGALLPGRVQTLLTTRWLPLEVLASVDGNSPMYNERDKAGIFYAQSWLLVHMLYLSADYRANFSQFVLALANGQDMLQAFLGVYHKGVQDVAYDLNQYIKSSKFFGAVFDVKLEKSAEDPQVSEVAPAESALLLADLLALVNKPDVARQAYEELAQASPQNPEVFESLAYLELRSGKQDAARQYFSRVYQAGTKSAQLCFDYATLVLQGDSEAKDAVPILRRAIDLKPDYVEARLQLGLVLTGQRSFAEALDQLRQIKKVNPDQAPSYFLALGYSYLGTSRLDEARKNAETAKKWAKTAADSEQVASLVQAIDATQSASVPSPAPPVAPLPKAPVQAGTRSAGNPSDDADRPTLQRRAVPAMEVHESAPRNPFIQKDDQMNRIEGTAQRLDCEGGSIELHVVVGRATMVFEIPDPDKVVIKHGSEVHHDFSCGAQKPYPITVYYAAKPDLKKGTAGIVREMDF
jgi:tetratricopeptide (TPR) repeat protein